jgi:hypothetical protein
LGYRWCEGGAVVGAGDIAIIAILAVLEDGKSCPLICPVDDDIVVDGAVE